MNPTSQLHWWPAVQGLGIPLPRTEIVTLDEPRDAEEMLYRCVVHERECYGDGSATEECKRALVALEDDVCAAAERLGFPVFLRTDLVSGKHSWRSTCFVPDAASLAPHLFNVTEEHAMALMFNAGAPLSAYVLRGMLRISGVGGADPLSAFAGLPIGRERRYFVRDGVVECHHPYWQDEENIGDNPDWKDGEHPEDWRERLRLLNLENEPEIALLSDYAGRVAQALPGAWSVDFAFGVDSDTPFSAPQWFLIDMAVAEESWHPVHA